MWLGGQGDAQWTMTNVSSDTPAESQNESPKGRPLLDAVRQVREQVGVGLTRRDGGDGPKLEKGTSVLGTRDHQIVISEPQALHACLKQLPVRTQIPTRRKANGYRSNSHREKWSRSLIASLLKIAADTERKTRATRLSARKHLNHQHGGSTSAGMATESLDRLTYKSSRDASSRYPRSSKNRGYIQQRSARGPPGGSAGCTKVRNSWGKNKKKGITPGGHAWRREGGE